MKTSLFGTNGVRGIVNRDLTPEVALDLGRAVGRTFTGTVAVATDARDSARMVRSALVSGIMAVGTRVMDLGLVPTPALQYYVRTHDDISGGVMVTASHNPQEYNGLKLVQQDGTESTAEDESALESFFSREITDAGPAGTGDMRMQDGAVYDYVEAIVSNVDADAIRAADLRICVDCANGASSESTPMLLRRLGVRSVTIGCDTGGIPHRESDPTRDSLKGLMDLVVAEGADLGVAHDGDGGRAVFVDGHGRFLNGDVSGAIVAKSILSEGKGKVVTPVSSSRVLEDTVTAAGGLLKYTGVGSHEVVRKMIENLAVFGVEEHGGMIFPRMQMARDGGMALAKMLEIVARNGPLADQVDALPRYSTVKLRVECPDDEKASVLEAFRRDAEGLGLHTDITDGVKIFYDDGWVLVRPSTTEQCFRIYSESQDPERAEALASEYAERARSVLNKG